MIDAIQQSEDVTAILAVVAELPSEEVMPTLVRPLAPPSRPRIVTAIAEVSLVVEAAIASPVVSYARDRLGEGKLMREVLALLVATLVLLFAAGGGLFAAWGFAMGDPVTTSVDQAE